MSLLGWMAPSLLMQGLFLRSGIQSVNVRAGLLAPLFNVSNGLNSRARSQGQHLIPFHLSSITVFIFQFSSTLSSYSCRLRMDIRLLILGSFLLPPDSVLRRWS